MEHQEVQVQMEHQVVQERMAHQVVQERMAHQVVQATQITNLSILGNWKHYIFEMRSDVSYTNNKIYVNGVSQSLSQVSGTENVSARTFNNGNGRISGWRTNTGYPMNINVAVFKVYNRILTQNEITQLFNKDKKRFNL